MHISLPDSERRIMAYKLYRNRKGLKDAVEAGESQAIRGAATKAIGNVAPTYQKSEVTSSGTDTNSSSGNSENFTQQYNSIISTLANYSGGSNLPGLSDIYAQLEALLRPALENAIADRQEYGESAMAELDADAYSRGMGGSTYLSGMKLREYDSIARDIARLESDYNAELAQYVYDATMEFNRIQAELYQIELQHRYAMEEIAYRNTVSGNGNSNADESVPSAEYDEYYNYLSSLDESDRNSFLNSNSGFWKKLREGAKSSLTPNEYERLINELFNINTDSGRNGNSQGSVGNGRGKQNALPSIYN